MVAPQVLMTSWEIFANSWVYRYMKLILFPTQCEFAKSKRLPSRVTFIKQRLTTIPLKDLKAYLNPRMYHPTIPLKDLKGPKNMNLRDIPRRC